MANPKRQPAFIVAGTNSSCGKTTVTLGIMDALRRRGIKTAPFKAGPDFIDPGHHRALLGRPSYNLDPWMMGADGVKKTFYANAAGCVGVIEGVMGLFDGKCGGKGGGAEGSTAHLAKILNVPVLLVVNAEKTAGSVWAVVKGFAGFDPDVNIKWVVFNKVANPRHFSMIMEARPRTVKIACLGSIPKDSGLILPERHLGLVTAEDTHGSAWKRFVKNAGTLAARYVDLDGLLKALPEPSEPPKPNRTPARRPLKKPVPRLNRARAGVRIAVAHDGAFCFYYEENLEVLKDLGAEIKFFSPLRDKGLPKDTDGIYIGGGYPELFARGLEANAGIRAEIKTLAESGMPVYAECGGLMYLGRSTKNLTGKARKMCGVFQWDTRMLDRRKALGYRSVSVRKGCPMLPDGGTLRGHEFHYSELGKIPPSVKKTFSFENSGRKIAEGYVHKNTLATYVHAHFASNRLFAKGFVELCRRLAAKRACSASEQSRPRRDESEE